MIVTETIAVPEHIAARQITVTLTLVDGATPVAGYGPDETEVAPIELHPDETGAYSADVTPNDVITPAGTAWRREIKGPGFYSRDFISVPSTGTTHEVKDILVEQPASVPSAALGLHLVDETAHDASSITFTPVGPISATNVYDAIVEVASEGGGGGGTSDHGNLFGLEDDDHPQYLTEERGDLRYEPIGGGGGGATDHGALTGLADDDHTQYLNNVRGDARYDALGAAAAAQAAAATDATTKANAAQAAAVQRGNHTGTQAISTVTGLQTALDGKASTTHATTHAAAGSDPLSLAASQITSGTLDDARIPANVARDDEVASLIAAEESARDLAISNAIAALIATAPGVLDTLDELAAALGDDPNFATTVSTALAGKQALNANLTAISGLTGAADRVAYFTGPGAVALATFTSFARSLLDDTDDAAMRSTLGLVIGTHVQAYSAVLAATTASFTTADETKLDGIETGADVTDATNVAAAGAAMVYVHNGTSYVLDGGRVFIGPEDPAADGFTLVDGDVWESTA